MVESDLGSVPVLLFTVYFHKLSPLLGNSGVCPRGKSLWFGDVTSFGSHDVGVFPF